MKLFNIPARFFFLTMPGLLLFACEENDALRDTGGKTTDKVPFVTVSGVASLYPAADTITYNVFYWAEDDDLQTLALRQGNQTALTGSLSVDAGGEVTITLDTVFTQEIDQLGDDLAHDPLDFETARNAYNKPMTYIVPAQYQLWEIKTGEEEAFAKVEELAYAGSIKTVILDALKNTGVNTTWEGLDEMVTAAGLRIESTIELQVRVHDMEGLFNDSPVRTVKIGVIEE